MKHNKKKMLVAGVVIVIAAIVAVVLSRGGGKEAASLDSMYCSGLLGYHSYTDEGIFYYGEGGISYLDVKTGKEVSICTKAGCRHEDKTCPARVDALYCTGIASDGKKLYYISSEDEQTFKSLNLMECDINGENRKKLANFPDIQTPTVVAYYGDNVIVGYNNAQDLEKREEVNNREAGIYVYNRKTKRGKKIYHTRAWENCISSIDVIDGYVYFCRLYVPLTEEEIMQQSAGDEDDVLEQILELYRVSLDGGEAEYIADDISALVAGVTGVGDMVLYSTCKGLQAYFPETKEVKTIREGEQISMVTSRLSEEKGIICQIEENGDGDDIYYICNKEGELTKLGKSPIFLLAVYDNVSYGIDDDGRVVLDTKRLMDGNFEVLHNFQAK